MKIQGKGAVKRVTVEATVIRADGRTEPLGIIVDSDKNPGILRGVSEWLQRQRS